jgi:hypothetical protein
MNTITETSTTNLVLNIAPNDLYNIRENEQLMDIYGQDIYEYSRDIEKELSHDFMKRHKLESKIRTKMIDWMIEVLYSFSCSNSTIFLSFDIMDNYINKTSIMLSNNDIHLIGIVSIFIASKMEDIVPIRMSRVISSISHNKYTAQDIRIKELKILNTLNFDLVHISTFEFIKTYIYDFCHNNKKIIEKLKMHKLLDSLDSITFYLCKLIAHSDEFSGYK